MFLDSANWVDISLKNDTYKLDECIQAIILLFEKGILYAY